MRKNYNVRFTDGNDNIIIECELYAEGFKSAATKALKVFKYQLYKYNGMYNISVKAV